MHLVFDGSDLEFRNLKLTTFASTIKAGKGNDVGFFLKTIPVLVK
jgi:hypothetical protein